jgi:hypothetical protein
MSQLLAKKKEVDAIIIITNFMMWTDGAKELIVVHT